MNCFFIQMRESIRAFLKEKDGASAIEYAIIAGLIAVVIIAGATFLGDEISDIFDRIGKTLKGMEIPDSSGGDS